MPNKLNLMQGYLNKSIKKGEIMTKKLRSVAILIACIGGTPNIYAQGPGDIVQQLRSLQNIQHPADNSGKADNNDVYTNRVSKNNMRFNEANSFNDNGKEEGRKAAECSRNNDWEGAINHYTQAIQYFQSAYDESRWNGYKKNLSIDVKNLNLVEANKLFDEACKLEKNGQYHDAEMTYRKSLVYDPTNANAYNYLGMALENQGLYKEAQEEYKHALTINKRTPYAAVNIVRVKNEMARLKSLEINENATNYFVKGDYKEAEILYKKAIAAYPIDVVIYDNLGLCQLKTGKYKEAAASFRKIIALDANNTEPYFHLAYAYYYNGELKKAETVYNNIINLEPRNAGAYYCLAKALRKDHMSSKAEINYRTAIALDPTQPVYYCDLANLLMKRAQFKEAADEYQILLKRDPANATAIAALTKMAKEGKIENTNIPVIANANAATGATASAQGGVASKPASDLNTLENPLGNVKVADPKLQTTATSLLSTGKPAPVADKDTASSNSMPSNDQENKLAEIHPELVPLINHERDLQKKSDDLFIKIADIKKQILNMSPADPNQKVLIKQLNQKTTEQSKIEEDKNIASNKIKDAMFIFKNIKYSQN